MLQLSEELKEAVAEAWVFAEGTTYPSPRVPEVEVPISDVAVATLAGAILIRQRLDEIAKLLG